MQSATKIKQKRHFRTTLVIALALMIPSNLAAQDTDTPPATSTPTPTPAPQPSRPGGFQLRPGTTTPAPSDVQGPVDAQSLPPREIRPDSSTPSTTVQPTPSPTPSSPPSSRFIQPLPPSASDQRATTRTPPATRTEAPAPTTPTTRNAPEPAQQAENDNDGQASTTAEDQPDPSAVLPAQPALPLPEITDLPAQAEPKTTPSNALADWLYTVLGLVIVGGLAMFFWRRRDQRLAAAVAAPVIESPRVDPAPSPEPSPVPSAGMPIASPEPISEPEPKPVPERASAVAAHPAAPARNEIPTINRSGPVKLEFVPLGAETTLFNAVIAYRLNVINSGDQPIRNIAVHALVEQARGDMMQQIPALEGADLLPWRHNHDSIEAGSSQVFEGELRLPLNTIEPIQVSGRFLFIPVTHFWIGYTEPDATRFAATRSFIIGEESTPPTHKVAPIRLELGPRKIKIVGQRPLLSA